MYYCNTSTTLAHVAELVDAADSKSAIRKGVKVRFLSWAQALHENGGLFYCPPLPLFKFNQHIFVETTIDPSHFPKR